MGQSFDCHVSEKVTCHQALSFCHRLWHLYD